MVFVRALSCLLIMLFSGIPAAMAAAATSAASNVQALQAEGDRISKDLSRLLFEARNPDTLSAGPSNPVRLRARAESAESSFLVFKAKLEAYLASPAAQDGSESSVVTFYFEQAIKVVQLRALTAVSGKVDFALYDFRIPYRMLERMSGFEQASTSDVVLSALADPNSMIALDRDSVRSASGELSPDQPVKLQIGRAFAERFVLVAKGGLSDERAFVTVVKSFAISAFLDQWEQIDQVRKTPLHDLPAIPGALAKELGVLGRPAEARAQRDVLASEPDRRGSIVNGYRQWFFENDKKEAKPNLKTLSRAEQDRLKAVADASRSAGLELADMNFLEGYFGAAYGQIPNTPENQAKKAGVLEGMRMSENAFIRLGLSQAMLGYPLPIAGTSQVELRHSLRKILAQAKFVAILPALQQVPAPPGKDAEVDAFLTRSLEEFAAHIPDRALDLWIAASQTAPGAEHAQAHREYVQAMLAEAVSLDHNAKVVTTPDAQADFELIKRIGRMTPEYRALRESARGDLELVLSPKDWGTSLQAYRLLLGKLKERENLARFAMETAKQQAYANEAQALRATAPHFALREAGPVDGKLTLGELGETDRAAYLGLSDSSKLNNSLLTVELEEKTPLFRQLAQLMKSSPQTAFAPAERLLERGFEALRSNIRADLEQLGKVAPLEPKAQIKELLPLIARSTLLKIQIPKAFPMLNDQLDAAVDTYLSGLHDRGIYAEAKEAFMRPMSGLMFLFLTKLALMAFRPTRPLARAVTALEVGINVETQGYMMAALPLLVADAGLDYAEYREARNDEAETRRWFSTSAEASSFYDYYSVADSETRTNAAWTKFSSSVKQQLLFIGVPMLAGLAKPGMIRAFDGWKIKKFDRLGFSSPEIDASLAAAQGERAANGAQPFTWNTQEIQARAKAKIEELRKSELYTNDRMAREKQIQADADSIVRFIQRQEKTARLMMQDFEREYRALGIPKGKETLNLRKLTEAKSILETRYRSYEISLEELEKGRKAFNEITGAVQAVWGGTFSPIRYLFYKAFRGTEPPRGSKEAFRERLYAEIYGFADYGANDSWFGMALPKRDYYEVLGLDYAQLKKMSEADAQAAIKSAFRKAARDNHPDTHPGDAAAEERFKEANEANRVLSDPKKKANYDAFRERAGDPKEKENRP